MRLDEAEACASVVEEDGAAEALVEALAEGVADEELCAVEFSEAQALNRSADTARVLRAPRRRAFEEPAEKRLDMGSLFGGWSETVNIPEG